MGAEHTGGRCPVLGMFLVSLGLSFLIRRSGGGPTLPGSLGRDRGVLCRGKASTAPWVILPTSPLLPTRGPAGLGATPLQALEPPAPGSACGWVACQHRACVPPSWAWAAPAGAHSDPVFTRPERYGQAAPPLHPAAAAGLSCGSWCPETGARRRCILGKGEVLLILQGLSCGFISFCWDMGWGGSAI